MGQSNAPIQGTAGVGPLQYITKSKRDESFAFPSHWVLDTAQTTKGDAADDVEGLQAS